MSLALCGPAQAAHPFDGLVTDADVGLAFDYLREAMPAAVQGREVAPPEALIRRAEVIAEEAQRRGGIAARAALDAIEREIRDSMRTPGSEPSSGAI
jgi:hypothetical protein